MVQEVPAYALIALAPLPRTSPVMVVAPVPPRETVSVPVVSDMAIPSVDVAIATGVAVLPVLLPISEFAASVASIPSVTLFDPMAVVIEVAPLPDTSPESVMVWFPVKHVAHASVLDENVKGELTVGVVTSPAAVADRRPEMLLVNSCVVDASVEKKLVEVALVDVPSVVVRFVIVELAAFARNPPGKVDTVVVVAVIYPTVGLDVAETAVPEVQNVKVLTDPPDNDVHPVHVPLTVTFCTYKFFHWADGVVVPMS